MSPPEPLIAECARVDAGLDGDGVYHVDLRCDGSAVRVSVDSTIAYLPSLQETTFIDYRVDGADRWLALRTESEPGVGVLVLGGISASRLHPPNSLLVEFFGDVILELSEDQPCQTPVSITCGEAKRAALDVSSPTFGQLGHVFDAESFLINLLAFGYAVEVERAMELLDPSPCGETHRFELLALWYSDP